MKKLGEIHEELLSLLKTVDTICFQNNIKYSLFGGTMIGAIRHRGFVPWDDDADIIMERKEYEKFITILPDDFEIYRAPWVPRFKKKETDLFIDIFVFDHTSNITSKQKLHILKLKFLQGTLKDEVTLNKGGLTGKILSLLTYIIGSPFGKGSKIKKYDKVSQYYNNKESRYIFSSFDQFKYLSHILPKTVVDKYKKVQFEDTKLMIMSGYHEYLTKFYGNYMKLPPVEERVPTHGNVDI
jgi:lipopolysaccharide cholinephosphotransferase